MASQINIINDLSNYTRIPSKILNKIIAKETLCIGSALHDATLANEDIVVLNIGIGTLSVELATRQCKFIPSRDLKAAIKNSLDDGVDPVELELEQELIDKLLHICEDTL